MRQQTVTITPTRRDSQNELTRATYTHLIAAQDARNRYYTTLESAIATYGDRHTPTIAGTYCQTCAARGHTDYDRANHQTGGAISGIYADHFPDMVKDRLRFYVRHISDEMDLALHCWLRAGRKQDTFRGIMRDYYTLADGRVSYY